MPVFVPIIGPTWRFVCPPKQQTHIAVIRDRFVSRYGFADFVDKAVLPGLPDRQVMTFDGNLVGLCAFGVLFGLGGGWGPEGDSPAGPQETSGSI